MIARKNGMDRRQSKRFKVPTDAFAIIKSPNFKIGQITDMSKGGLSFCYIDKQIKLHEIFSVDILLADDGFYLDKIPVKIAWDDGINACVSLQSKAMKRCGVTFDNMSIDQQALLHSFVPKHAGGFVLDRRSPIRLSTI